MMFIRDRESLNQLFHTMKSLSSVKFVDLSAPVVEEKMNPAAFVEVVI